MNFINKSMALAVVSCLILPLASADDGEKRGKRRGPPPTEAIEACTSQAEGAVCSFIGHRGDEVQGSCSVVPNDTGVIACKPQRGRGKGERNSQTNY